MTSQNEQTQPTADMDLSVLPDEAWIFDQQQLVAKVTESGNTESIAVDFGGSVTQLVILTTRGAKTGVERKTPVVRVEHQGHYAAVASKGGAASSPAWYHNLVAHPEVEIWDGTSTKKAVAREVHGEERALWWDRAAKLWPSYLDYQSKTDRLIPVLVLEPVV